MNAMTPLDAIEFSAPLVPSAISGVCGTLQWIALDKLVIDKSYQRDVGGSGKKNIRRIVENFAWHLFSPLIVAPRDTGRFAIIDGQHRAIAAQLHGGVAEVPCLILHCSREAEARAFAVINGHVTKVTAQYLFRAKLVAGDASATSANRAASNAGVRILTATASAAAVKFNETQAAGTIERCFAVYGGDVLTDALSLIILGSKGDGGCLRGGSIIAFCDLLRDHPKWRSRIAEVADILASYGLARLITECMAKDPNDTGIRGGMRCRLVAAVTKLLQTGAVAAKPAPVVAKAKTALPPSPPLSGRFYSAADAKRATRGRA